MSWLEKLFGKKEENDKDKFIQKLRETEDMLRQKELLLGNTIRQEIETAKKNRTKNKWVALQALRRKKECEKQLLQVGSTLSTMETRRKALQAADISPYNLEIMRESAEFVGQNKFPNIIEEIDIDDLLEMSQEISDTISRPPASGQDIDHDDKLEKELEESEQEELDKELLRLEELPEPRAGSSGNSRQPVAQQVIADEDKLDWHERISCGGVVELFFLSNSTLLNELP